MLADRYTLETPDQVEIEFELAGVGSRFCAMALDSALIALVVLVLGIFSMFFQGWWSYVTEQVERTQGGAPSIVFSILILILGFLFSGGYYLFFEHVMRGQTPGKRTLRIRAIRDDGAAMLGQDLLIRNLLRFVDFLPAFYGVGALVMFFHPQCKRLGDIAAGTIVVKEGQLDYRGRTDKKYKVAETSALAVNRELRPEHHRLIAGYLARRAELLPTARSKLAGELAHRMQAIYGGDALDPERYLELLQEGRHYEFRTAARLTEGTSPTMDAAPGTREPDAAQGTAADSSAPSAGADPAVS